VAFSPVRKSSVKTATNFLESCPHISTTDASELKVFTINQKMQTLIILDEEGKDHNFRLGFN